MSRKRKSAIDLWDESGRNVPKPIEVVEEEMREPEPEPQGEPDDMDDIEGDDDSEDEDDNRRYNQTCVTPLIADLAQALYKGLLVAGDNSREKTIDSITTSDFIKKPQYVEFLDRLLELYHSGVPPRIKWDDKHLICRRGPDSYSNYYSAVNIDGIEYRPGNIVMMPAGETKKEPQPEFPHSVRDSEEPVTAGNLFWFAKILSIERDNNSIHVQWLTHSSKTILGDIGHPQELFLTDQCGKVDLTSIIGKCPCERFEGGKRPLANGDHNFQAYNFFYSMTYDIKDAVFRDITDSENDPIENKRRPNSCLLCMKRRDAEEEGRSVANYRRRRFSGVVALEMELRGKVYHVHDVVFAQSNKDDGPCLIGKITRFEEEGGTVHLQLFGRINDRIRRSDNLVANKYEEQHLFFTDEEVEVEDSSILDKAFVCVKGGVSSLKSWLSASPNHFYITKHADTLIDGLEKGLLRRIGSEEFEVCSLCIKDRKQEIQDFKNWESGPNYNKLRVFDPFAGCGAFALAACEAGNMELTHAIDIVKSATDTLRRNSPDTTVYNQCSNKMLEYAVKKQTDFGWMNNLEDITTTENLPPPPTSQDVDCIISGFPCQSHSSLNQNKGTSASQALNELLLNTLSWVDLIRPNYILFENVKGFVEHEVAAVRVSRYVTRGGIKRGGIKLLCRALICMGYQIRFGLLQAACYGAPQSRKRFFLWGAKSGLVLPEFPIRTHNFNNVTLEIAFESGDIVNPRQPRIGDAPRPFVTVKDAISDLPSWDWKNPHKKIRRTVGDREDREERMNMGIEEYGETEWWCGRNNMGFAHQPRSAFQARCRRQQTFASQHITMQYSDHIYEIVCNIPFGKNSNYKNLNNKTVLWQYQFSNAQSSVGKHGYRNELFQRLDPDGYFNTIVTNIGPTAKQSKVLHPWCKRVCTVREWARGQGFPDDFTFVAHDKKVLSMHKLIGNAVPWPLGEALGRELLKARYKQYVKERDMNDTAVETTLGRNIE